ncbi:mediator of RNA polymerase II transcription subunit 1-like [Nothoprocta perdicaria]|uniref:mediator of RNA polymerase II transcription subunit 1-like n=1 Tax=Nothoprocta perdicaria TaxID=30464 RepID=UPI000E1BAF68|nr:mediator of RNA polymerase II transcription subunit 1-like [Nothoprocta perdicaria]
MAYNTLISSCVSEKHINEDDSELLYFEVAPQKNTSVSVSFPHPMKDNLACVVINVITSREIQCSLHLHPQDPTLNSSDDFISRAVKRCMSIPVVMRAIFRNAAKGGAGSKTEDKDVDTEQRPASPCELIPGPNGLKETPSGAGLQDLVAREKQSAQGGTDERLSTADL